MQPNRKAGAAAYPASPAAIPQCRCWIPRGDPQQFVGEDGVHRPCRLVCPGAPGPASDPPAGRYS